MSLAVSPSLPIKIPRAYATETEAKKDNVGAGLGAEVTGVCAHEFEKKIDLARSTITCALLALVPAEPRPSSSLAQANILSARARNYFTLKHGRIFMVSSTDVAIRDRMVRAEGNNATRKGVTAA